LSPDLIGKANDATNDLATWLKALIDETADGVHVVADKLRPVIVALEKLFADPDNPLPDPPAEQPTVQSV
jgi:hypothetical protein